MIAPKESTIFLSCRALLYGAMKESFQKEVVLNDVSLSGFKIVLSFIYTGQLKLGQLEVDTLLETLSIAHLYGLDELLTAIRMHLEENLTRKNVFKIYDKAQFLHIESLCDACLTFMDAAPQETLENEDFSNLSAAALRQLLLRDTFCAGEIDILKAVGRWCSQQTRNEDSTEVLKAIRLRLIGTEDFKPQVHTIYERNLATPEYGALKLSGEAAENTFARRGGPVYASEVMPPAPSAFKVGKGTNLIVALSKHYSINNVNFELPDEEPFRCSYYVEGSVNLETWFELIDHSKYSCRSQQRLYFPARSVRFIRVIVKTEKDLIELSRFEAIHTKESFEIARGFFSPATNVASEASGAAVIEGRDCYEGSCISEESESEHESGGWTYFDHRTKSITIQLSQPYTVGSMRMALNTLCRYYIETSIDEKEWTRVADHTRHPQTAWQNIAFNPLPVIFIRIVCTGDALTPRWFNKKGV